MPQTSSEASRFSLKKFLLKNRDVHSQNGRLAAKPEASPLANLLKTSLPTVVDLASQTIMWTIESILIGRISAAAFGGFGMAIQVIVLCMTVLLTFVVGSSLIINRNLGGGDRQEANHIFGQTMIIGSMIAIGLALFWFFGATQIFKLIKEGGMEAELAGVRYLRTIAVFSPFIITNFIAVGVIRGIGETKFSMMINLGINALNLVLSPLLIFGFFGLPRLEVQGAAFAAGLSHTAGFVATFYLVRSRKSKLFLSLREMAQPNFTTLKRLFKAGFPTTIEQLVWAFGQLVVTSFVALLGIHLLAAHQAFMRIQAILSMFYMGFGLGAMTLMGQNLGADRQQLAERTAEVSGWVMYAFVMIVILLLVVFSQPILSVFTSDPKVITAGLLPLTMFALTQLPKAVNNVLMGNLRGAGDLKWLMWLSVAAVIVFEIGANAIVIFLMKGGLLGLWLVHMLDETIRLAANYWRFNRGKWKFLNI